MTPLAILFAALLSWQQGPVTLEADVSPETIDLARNASVTLTLAAPADTEVTLPDLTSRTRGFLSAEPLEAEPVKGRDGRVTRVVDWKLVPDPCAAAYKIAPFAVTASRAGKDLSFVAGPIRFAAPEPVTDAPRAMTVTPEKDEPHWTWRRVGRLAAWILGGLVALALFVALPIVYLARRVKEHRMRPIDRALAELGRLVARRLPQHGRYKDFYVELTMVVRRYVQRKYGIRAPHLTTEEFLRELLAREAEGARGTRSDFLREFLESADLVKFAGQRATAELADAAVVKARGYLNDDNLEPAASEPSKTP